MEKPTIPLHWGPLAARSVLHLSFATVALAPQRGWSVPDLAVLVAVLVLLDSCITVFCAVPRAMPRGVWRIQATTGLVAGALIACSPHISAQRVVGACALWALTCGACDIGLEVRVRRIFEQSAAQPAGPVRGALMLAGSSLAGALALAIVAASGLFVPEIWLGLHCLFVGAAMGVFAWRLRQVDVRRQLLLMPRAPVGQIGTLYALIK